MGVSIKDVAKLANVSTSTVSHVVNKTRKVNPNTKDRVLDAIDKLNYELNPIASSLRSGNSNFIGFVVSHLSNFFLDIGLTMEEEFSKEGYQLIYLNSNEDKEKEKENIKNLVKRNIAGLIIAPVDSDCSYMNQIIGDKCPVVFFDRKPYGFKRDSILSTNNDGAFDGTSILLDRGYTNLGFIGSHRDETMIERFEGFKLALAQRNIAFDEANVKIGSVHGQASNLLKYGECFQFAKDFIENKKVEAIFCGNDIASIGVINYLKENNINIPEDIDLVCFDDPIWLQLTYKNISVVDQDWMEIANAIKNLFWSRLKKTNTEPYSEIRIPTKLVLR